MGYQNIQKVVTERLLVCDLCGEEIKPSDDQDAKLSLIDWTHLDNAPKDKPLQTINRVRFMWPTKAMKEKHRKEGEEYNRTVPLADRKSTYMKSEDWDMHGECIAALLKTAVTMRKQREEDEKNIAAKLEEEP